MENEFWKSLSKWSAYIEAGPFTFFGGQIGMRPDGRELCMRYSDLPGFKTDEDKRYSWVDRIEAPVATQAAAIYEKFKHVLSGQRGDLSNLVRLHLYQKDKRFFPVFDNIRRRYEPFAPTPSTAVGMRRFDPLGEARFCIDGIALRGNTNSLGTRTDLGGFSGHASAAHYSHVVGAGPYLFIAGQIPIDTSKSGAPLIRGYEDIPEEGRFLRVGRSHEDTRNGPIASQTWFTYDLIGKHLKGAGSSYEQILNLTVYLQDMRDFPTFHRVHERFFPRDPPALTVVEVGEVGHKGTLIEIEPTALLSDVNLDRKILLGEEKLGAQMGLGTQADGLLFLSGLSGLSDIGEPIQKKNELPLHLEKEAPRNSFEAMFQAISILDQLEVSLGRVGAGLEQIVHLTVFLRNIEDLIDLEPLFENCFPKRRPAITVVEVSQPSPVLGSQISITAIAWMEESEN